MGKSFDSRGDVDWDEALTNKWIVIQSQSGTTVRVRTDDIVLLETKNGKSAKLTLRGGREISMSDEKWVPNG